MPIFVVPPYDSTAQVYIDRWLREAGGKLPMRDFVEKFQKRFHCLPVIYDDAKVRNFDLGSGLYKIENNAVSHLSAS